MERRRYLCPRDFWDIAPGSEVVIYSELGARRLFAFRFQSAGVDVVHGESRGLSFSDRMRRRGGAPPWQEQWLFGRSAGGWWGHLEDERRARLYVLLEDWQRLLAQAAAGRSALKHRHRVRRFGADMASDGAVLDLDAGTWIYYVRTGRRIESILRAGSFEQLAVARCLIRAR